MQTVNAKFSSFIMLMLTLEEPQLMNVLQDQLDEQTRYELHDLAPRYYNEEFKKFALDHRPQLLELWHEFIEKEPVMQDRYNHCTLYCHSTGDWVFKDVGERMEIGVDGQPTPFAVINNTPTGEKLRTEIMANTRLMAGAPMMYRALDEAEHHLKDLLTVAQAMGNREIEDSLLRLLNAHAQVSGHELFIEEK